MISGITWIAVKIWLKKVWLVCKKYWQIFLGISIPLVLMVIFRKKFNLAEVLDRARDDHQKEVDTLNKSYQDEIEARDKAQKRYLDTIEQLEENYKSSQKKLETAKKKEIEKILKNHKDDPEEITRRIADLTGFKIRVE